MSEITNQDRAGFFAQALETFAKVTKADVAGDLEHNPEVVVSDLLTNCIHWCAQRRIDFNKLIKDSSEMFLQEMNDELQNNLDCYIQPSEATRIRIFEQDSDGWCIDAARPDGQKFTEKIWTHYDDEPLSKGKAIEVVAEFAAEIGRPDLLSEVYIDQTGFCGWEKIEIGKGGSSEVPS